jgi:hypothetical protein
MITSLGNMQDKAYELQQQVSDTVNKVKSNVQDAVDNPKLIIEKAEEIIDEPLLDD